MADMIAVQREVAMDVVHCTIIDLYRHPRLTDRTKATVRVLLKEVLGGVPAVHAIDLHLVVITDSDEQADTVRRIVLTKTAKLLLRLLPALDASAAAAAAAHFARAKPLLPSATDPGRQGAPAKPSRMDVSAQCGLRHIGATDL
jgi:hypothetical protein